MPGLLEQRVDDDVIVVDPAGDVACALTGASAVVWDATGESADATAWAEADRSFGETRVEAVVEELLDLGLLVEHGRVARRMVLRAGGGLAATGGVMALTLPTAEAADSMIGAQSRTFTCTEAAQATPTAATAQTLTVGASTTARTVAFTVVSGGGAGGGIQTNPPSTARASQTVNPGRGGNGGTVSGTFTLPAGAATQISVFVGCGGADTPVANNLYTSYSPAGHGPGGRSYARASGTTLLSAAGGAGGGASAVLFPGESTASLNPGAGGGGGNAAPSSQTTPNGGAGIGIGSGAAGSGTGAGGGGTTTTGGAAGTTSGTNVPSASTAGSGPGTNGGTGGNAGGAFNSATTANVTVGANGGGGGGGYTGGGGGGGTTTSATVSASGGDGGGSGYAGGAAVGGAYTTGTITVSITAAGVQSTGTYGPGGAPGTAGTGEVNAGSPGVATFTNTGGFTLT